VVRDALGANGVHVLSPAVIDRLRAYSWPGNVRELKSVLQSAVNLAQGKAIEVTHLPEHMRKLPKSAVPHLTAGLPKTIRPLAEVEKELILSVYSQLDQNKSQAAKALGIGLNTLRRKQGATSFRGVTRR